MRSLSLFAPEHMPLLAAGQPLLPVLLSTLAREGFSLQDGDVLVLAQKIVSKAEGRYRDLAEVQPSQAAHDYATRCRKDPRYVQAVLDESQAVLRCVPGTLIVRHRLGLTMANAGIDQSNIDAAGRERVLLLPAQPDLSAAQLRQGLKEAMGVDLAVLISDSFGRPWRLGTTGVCIGCAGIEPLDDRRGQPDLYGRTLQMTQSATADAIAASAGLLMGEAAEGRPVAVLRGWQLTPDNRPASLLLRPGNQDLFQ
jgi:coenzyme F420-0:L-glutamate ligase/coenzyme F420-1:gamma-L-glutamate ligase